MTSHTPGPWKVDAPNYDSTFVFAIRGRDGETIADTCGSVSPYRDLDARLIAAAPDLLEALRDCLEYGHKCAAENDERPLCLVRASAAIRKATEAS